MSGINSWMKISFKMFLAKANSKAMFKECPSDENGNHSSRNNDKKRIKSKYFLRYQYQY